MKTKEEQNALKEKAEAESKEPRKLTEEELEQANGGGIDLTAYLKTDATRLL